MNRFDNSPFFLTPTPDAPGFLRAWLPSGEFLCDLGLGDDGDLVCYIEDGSTVTLREEYRHYCVENILAAAAWFATVINEQPLSVIHPTQVENVHLYDYVDMETGLAVQACVDPISKQWVYEIDDLTYADHDPTGDSLLQHVFMVRAVAGHRSRDRAVVAAKAFLGEMRVIAYLKSRDTPLN